MTLSDAQVHALQEALPSLETDVPLAPHTTFRIGGAADWYVAVQTADELATALRVARRHDIPFFLLGTGANVIVGDRGVRGLVIHNRARHTDIDPDTNRLWAESGAIVYPDLIETAVSAGLSGLEHYVGIPSTVGGALWQNLHFLSPPPERERTMFIEEVVHSADVLTEEDERKTVEVDYFEFGYDDSILHHRDDVVLAATFQLDDGDVDRMREIMDANLQWRAERHPPLDTEPSVGSIFKKIEGVGAGRLIDNCGLKGTRIGGAMITHRHANIFVNAGDATAADVCALIDLAQETVEEETGYRLETEIDFVGEFAPPTDAEPTVMQKDPDLVTAAERAEAA
ncbi:MAG: UDP-N-acetylenolpyruvoylglucosamine reductase [Bacteroidetes bacterium SW_9_63_38]|nr:MAG: UDP-N-acetylenolpyruvoylglucosamine reductase [Bacteroidetes bacterium SW_9_63_38]